MATVRLTDKSIRRPAPASGQVELWDDLVKGFGLRIAAGGSRTFFVMARINGKLTRRTVGRAAAPNEIAGPRALSLTLARERARGMLAQMAGGQDPGKTRKARPRGDAANGSAYPEGSFGRIAEMYLNDKLAGGGAGLKSRRELERKLKTDLKPWHRKPIGEIRGRDIREIVREKAQLSPVAANRLLSFVKRVFRWAVMQDYVIGDPAAGISKPTKETSRSRYLSEDEIRLFWRACDRMGEPAGRMFKLALVTAQRRGEVAGLRRSELGELAYKERDPTTEREVVTTGHAWLLPEDRTKRNVAHTVPLSPLAKSLIDAAPRLEIGGKPFDHVFPSGRRGDQAVTGWSRFKDRLDRLIGELMAEDAEETYDPQRHAIPAWHIHDLRATAATHMEMPRLGVAKPVISRVLNHSEGDGRSQTSKYTRHTWDKEAAEALDLWAKELERIVGLNVVELRDRRG